MKDKENKSSLFPAGHNRVKPLEDDDDVMILEIAGKSGSQEHEIVDLTCMSDDDYMDDHSNTLAYDTKCALSCRSSSPPKKTNDVHFNADVKQEFTEDYKKDIKGEVNPGNYNHSMLSSEEWKDFDFEIDIKKELIEDHVTGEENNAEKALNNYSVLFSKKTKDSQLKKSFKQEEEKCVSSTNTENTSYNHSLSPSAKIDVNDSSIIVKQERIENYETNTENEILSQTPTPCKINSLSAYSMTGKEELDCLLHNETVKQEFTVKIKKDIGIASEECQDAKHFLTATSADSEKMQQYLQVIGNNMNEQLVTVIKEEKDWSYDQGSLNDTVNVSDTDCTNIDQKPFEKISKSETFDQLTTETKFIIFSDISENSINVDVPETKSLKDASSKIETEFLTGIQDIYENQPQVVNAEEVFSVSEDLKFWILNTKIEKKELEICLNNLSNYEMSEERMRPFSEIFKRPEKTNFLNGKLSELTEKDQTVPLSRSVTVSDISKSISLSKVDAFCNRNLFSQIPLSLNDSISSEKKVSSVSSPNFIHRLQNFTTNASTSNSSLKELSLSAESLKEKIETAEVPQPNLEVFKTGATNCGKSNVAGVNNIFVNDMHSCASQNSSVDTSISVTAKNRAPGTTDQVRTKRLKFSSPEFVKQPLSKVCQVPIVSKVGVQKAVVFSDQSHDVNYTTATNCHKFSDVASSCSFSGDSPSSSLSIMRVDATVANKAKKRTPCNTQVNLKRPKLSTTDNLQRSLNGNFEDSAHPNPKTIYSPDHTSIIVPLDLHPLNLSNRSNLSDLPSAPANALLHNQSSLFTSPQVVNFREKNRSSLGHQSFKILPNEPLKTETSNDLKVLTNFRNDPRIVRTTQPIFQKRIGTQSCLSRFSYQNVGKVFLGDDFPIMILQWNPAWLVAPSNSFPPICDFYPNINFAYENELHYYNTYTPLHLLSLWLNLADTVKRNPDPLLTACDFVVEIESKCCVKIICHTLLKISDVRWLKREDIILCSSSDSGRNTHVFFGRVTSVMYKACNPPTSCYSQNVKCHKYKIEFWCTLAPSVAFKWIKMQIVSNIRVSLMQNQALQSINESFRNVVLDPRKNKTQLRIVRCELAQDTKLVRDLILQALKSMPSPVVLVDTSKIVSDNERREIILLIVQVAYALKCRNDTLVLICTNNVNVLCILAHRLKPYDPVVAVRSRDVNTRDDLKPFILELMKKEKISEVYNRKNPIILTLFSSFLPPESMQIFSQHSNVVCLVDEADLCLEIDTALPLSLPSVKKLVLIGNSSGLVPGVPEVLQKYWYHIPLIRRLHTSQM